MTTISVFVNWMNIIMLHWLIKELIIGHLSDAAAAAELIEASFPEASFLGFMSWLQLQQMFD